MEIAEIAAVPDEATVAALAALWERCGLTRPWNDPTADIRFAAAGPASTVLIGRVAGTVAASVMVGHDGHRGAVYYVAVDPAHGRKGHGRAIMAAAESWLAARGVPKLNLMVRPENAAVAAFYRALGYETEERLVLARRL
ncbi:GNAT family acetyltransferase [Acuticoccus mangrovi]|uniref:GNAT family acetyltransferase n=1 Tax=Acuticoccus mangrovi TaxID=2796142 RepID=A0A934IRY6_9HYPH|nr:GNAT family acetyltransferase [Acuticoccus mangrovi]MBJ3776955.1 GNAT family acetyltransferase [Acuticoccus mangrovi]